MSNDLKILDPEILSTLQEAIGDSLPRIINLYLSDTPKNLHEMGQGLEQSDFATVGRLAHSLKSSSANLGAMQLSVMAQDLEQNINQGMINHDDLKASITKIKQTFDLTRLMFDSYLSK